jgi:hypothetical protein
MWRSRQTTPGRARRGTPGARAAKISTRPRPTSGLCMIVAAIVRARAGIQPQASLTQTRLSAAIATGHARRLTRASRARSHLLSG